MAKYKTPESGITDKSTVTTVKFVNTSKEVKDTLAKLSKTALREAGKVVRKHLRDNIPKRSKRFKNHIGTWAFIDRKTGQPQLQVGFYSWQRVRKKGKKPSHANPHWIEFGVERNHFITPKNAKVLADKNNIYGLNVNHPGTRATHVLRDTVNDNIDEIRKVQEKYLAELNKELEAAAAKVYTGADEDESD